MFIATLIAAQHLSSGDISAAEDALRGAQCATRLLHTLPSHAMQMDAIAQGLVARKWNRPLVLHGPLPGDRLLLDAWRRASACCGCEARPG